MLKAHKQIEINLANLGVDFFEEFYRPRIDTLNAVLRVENGSPVQSTGLPITFV